ncbi:histidinol dehydrogenase [Thermohalobacter berrensis]|uniref:Histidinol dehydrogenase n=1 Tax=Thermohalobacter berrensis TaxID=99594 RepID=A0A419T680_9FIRM|nr:histidinol dehydrogenase [Thermohalobacter berrensis]RKD32923.1 histidinol dehydrogenase [Thermohalobacter berrensis]
MIRIINLKEEGNKDIKAFIRKSKVVFNDVTKGVEKIIEDVKKNGDKAVIEYTKKFDGIKLNNFYVSNTEIEDAYKDCEDDFIKALENAKENIKEFHKKQLKNSWIWNKDKGITLGQLYNPIYRVGIYVPGGTAAYPSTVLMNAIPAKVAGVKEIVMVTPPDKNGQVNKAILAAAKIAGVNKIFKIGGAQAVGALAFGTETIPKVDKIVGPGNIYVATAKKLVYGSVDIDMIAGPSEILIIGDENSNPKYIAADMLGQAEHDELASSILITTSIRLAEMVKNEIKEQVKGLSRREIIEKSLKDFGAIIVVEDLQKAIDLSNEIAPEHLELMVDNAFEIVNEIKNAGAIFIGEYSPEALGDYLAGPNHTLPTSGTAKFFSPLGVDDFMKKSSLIYYSRESLMKDKDKIIKLAAKEGLTAHGNSIKVRFE